MLKKIGKNSKDIVPSRTTYEVIFSQIEFCNVSFHTEMLLTETNPKIASIINRRYLLGICAVEARCEFRRELWRGQLSTLPHYIILLGIVYSTHRCIQITQRVVKQKIATIYYVRD